MTRLPAHSLLSLATIALASGCSGSDAGSTVPATGGDTSIGGTASGGASNSGLGGATTGGLASAGGAATGGASAAGGLISTGGAITTGGANASGGSSAAPGGGPNATGGMTSASTGGMATTGGTATGGGSKATGGTNVVGGSAATAGSQATGGSTSNGGNVATGGSKATGGSTSNGGNAATGGSKATGGSAATGGSKATGGTSATGGGTSTGACVESTCGSHKWPCWKMPNPVSEGLPNPQSYTDLGNGTVLDKITCLTWEKANPSTQDVWQTNYNRCASLASSNYAGHNDWRLPTRVEMASITDVTRGATGYPTVFSVTSGYYTTASWWYESIAPYTQTRVWGYGTNGFTSNAIVMTDQNQVARCVRGNGTGEAYNALAVEPAGHYAVTGTGTAAVVTDNYTGLTWQQTFSSARMAWSAAPAYCASQTTGGLSGWRVPTLNELASTVNEGLVGPAINRTVFPGVPYCGATAWFWAREAYNNGTTYWGINYCDGFTGYNSGASGAWNYFTDGYVRCVR
jgi:hypothetical protein